MQNKRNKNIDFGFTPSEYQQKIFDFVTNGVGNAVIKASAGSAKTTTGISAMKLIPKNKKCLFIAFNKSVVEELSKKLEGYNNCTVRTIHGLGYLIVRRNLGNDIEINEYKYRTFLKNSLSELTDMEDIIPKQMIQEYIDNITLLIDYSRFNLAQSVNEIKAVAAKYDIPIFYDECEVTLKCLEWGKENFSTIDYTDMVWLPYELSLRPSGLQFDWIVIDECQDLSLLSIQLFLKCLKRGSRFIALGDSSQAIYSFAGASEDAFNFMCNLPNTTVFPLPVSYRCAKSITRLANTLVPEMKCRDDAEEGMIINDCSIGMIKNGDMVLSRSKAPLVKLYTKLIRRGVNCYIKGQDISKNLISMLESIDTEELDMNLNSDGVFTRLYDRLFNDRNKLMMTRGLDIEDATLSSYIMSTYDSINSLYILAECVSTKSELIEHIRKVFKDDSEGVCLSTIHKAKGLESENVYILCHSMMPCKNTTHEWEKIQEKNLLYVAYTRAKNKLGFISEKEVPPCGNVSETSAILNELNYIENKICKVLGKEPMIKMEKGEIAKMNLRTATKIEDLPKQENNIILDKKENVGEDNALFNELLDFVS